jgi:hypothetical protein
MKAIGQSLLVLVLVVSLPILAGAEDTRMESPRTGSASSSMQQSGGLKFLFTFSLHSNKDARDEAIARFKKTKGEPPKGVKLLGRVTRLDFSKVYVLVESQDSAALAQYAFEWSDLMDVYTVPVMDDTRLMEVLERVQQ